MKQSIQLLGLLLCWFTPIIASAQDVVNVKFSVYLMPSQRQHVNENFKRNTEIFYAYGKKNIPLSLKESRQSMAYPYKGVREMTFFNVKTVDGEETRLPLFSSKVPTGASKGIILLRVDKDGSYKSSAHWFKASELLGGGKIYNLSGKTIALNIDKNKKLVVIKPKQKIQLKAKFNDKSGYGYIPVSGYTQVEKADGRKVRRKSLVKNLIFKEDDAHLVLIVSNLRNSLKSRCLLANGVANLRDLKALQKYLPHYMREKTTPAVKSTNSSAFYP